jgi:hypothetical protein
VAFISYLIKSPLLKIFPKILFLGSASHPNKKFILALVEGMYGSKINDNRRIKLQMAAMTI